MNYEIGAVVRSAGGNLGVIVEYNYITEEYRVNSLKHGNFYISGAYLDIMFVDFGASKLVKILYGVK